MNQTEILPVGYAQSNGNQDDGDVQEGEIYDLPVVKHLSFCSLENAQIESVLVRQEKGIRRVQQDQADDKRTDIALCKYGLDR